MSTILARVGEAVPLVLVLEDCDTTKFPQAQIFDDVGTVAPIATANLTHVASGYYFASYTVASANKFTINYTVYDDAARTIVSTTHGKTQELLHSDVPEDPATILSELAEAQLNCAYDDDLLILRAAAWMDRGGQTVTSPTSATITVRDQAHGLITSDTTTSSTNGVFIFEASSISLDDNKVGYVQVSITDAQGTASTVQSFATIA
jgi:hypothetical protein